MEITIFTVLLLATLALGLPIAYSMAAAAFALVVLFFEGMSLNGVMVIMSQRMYSGVDSFPLLAIPLFFLAGTLMDGAGLSERLIKLAATFVGQIRGGLLMVVVLAEAFLAAVAGSPSAVAAAIGSVVAPALKERGYEPGFSTAVIAAGATVGPIIPPSILLVIYGALANVSIARLFLGGVVPGLLMALAMMGLCYVVAVWRNYPPEEKASFPALMRAIGQAALPLGAPVIILGGIFSGIFTATESAAAACLYAAFVGFFVYRSMDIRSFLAACLEAAIGSARIMVIIAMAAFVGWVLARQQIPQAMADSILSLSQSPLIVLLMINALFLLLGCFVEGIALMIILLPTVIPVMNALHIDLVFFGVMIVMNLTIGSITPPVGTCLIVASAVTKTPFQQSAREIFPFVAILSAVLLLIMVFPQVVLWLPDLLMSP